MSTKKILIILFSIWINKGISQCKLDVKKITIFKDATVFVEKEGVCDTEDKTIYIDLPYKEKIEEKDRYRQLYDRKIKNNIIFGTIEVETPNNEVITKQTTTVSEKKQVFSSIYQIFHNNIGKEIEIVLNGKSEKIKGTIFSIEDKIVYQQNQAGINTVTLKQGDKWKFIKLSEIDSFEFTDQAVLYSEPMIQRLLINLKKDKQDQQLKLSYLRKGITWTPNYFISIKPNNKLSLSLKANIINDVEDLSDANVNLAVGIPIFKYSTVAAPLASDDKVIDLINGITNPNKETTDMFRNSIGTQRTISASALEEIYGNNTKGHTEGKDDDIFLYQIDNVSMKRGDRTNVNITEFETSYKDVYTVGLQSNDNIISNSNRYNQKDNKNDVWHSVEFINKADVPLTTGSVFFKKYNSLTKAMVPISQEMLGYTPIGEKCIAKMSISPNIIVSQSEKEISRKKDTAYLHRDYDYIVRVKGEIEVINLKNKAIDMIVNRNIKAIKLLESSEPWKTMQTYRQIFERNQNNITQWNFVVEPQKKKIISYEYEIFVRN